MDWLRKTAILVGVLFIVATFTAILSLIILGSTLDPSEYLTAVSTNEFQVIITVILWLILSVSVLGIGVFMFPVLKKYNEGLALGYVGLRLIETIFIIIGSLSVLTLLSVSQEFVAGGFDPSYYQPLGTLLLALQDWSWVIGTMIFLGLGGLPLYYLLYISHLIPRILSLWGLLGALLILLYGVLGLFGFDLNIPVLNLLAAPIAVQEMVFAVWLIVKGFNTPGE
jgi:hypothetical protein